MHAEELEDGQPPSEKFLLRAPQVERLLGSVDAAVYLLDYTKLKTVEEASLFAKLKVAPRPEPVQGPPQRTRRPVQGALLLPCLTSSLFCCCHV